MKEIEKKEVIRPVLQVWGVKKRARKSKFHSFDFKSRAPEAVDIEKLKSLCAQAMQKYMRKVEKAELSLQPQTLTVYDNGMESSTFLMFSDEKIELEVPTL